MSYPRFLVYAGHSADLGTFAASAAIADSTVILKFGSDSKTHKTIDSADDEDDELSWDGSALSIKLTAETVDALPVGLCDYQVTVMTSGGVPILGPRGTIRRFSSLP